jgi:threonine dehydratase
MASVYKTIEQTVGNTPLVELQRMAEASGNVVLVKLEGNNPAGSVKDRPALSMVAQAEKRGTIKPGDTLIEATSGNTGIALAMAAAMRGFRMILVMPEHLSPSACVTTARASSSTSSPIRTIRSRTTREPARKSGVIPAAASRISCPAWARPARSWAYRGI